MLTKSLLLSVWIVLLASFTSAQESSGKFKIRIVKSNFPALWKQFSLRNQDTIIHFRLPDLSTRATFDKIPFGRYSMELYSEFGDKIVSPVYIAGGVSKLKVNVDRYYKKDIADAPFIDRLSEKDTLKVLAQVNGCFDDYSTNYNIIKSADSFFIFCNDSPRMLYQQLDQLQIKYLRETETGGRKFPKPKTFSTTTSDYFFCLGKAIIHFKSNGTDYLKELCNENK